MSFEGYTGWFLKKYAFLKKEGYPDLLIRKFKIYEKSELGYETYGGTSGWYKSDVWTKIKVRHEAIEEQVDCWYNSEYEAKENAQIVITTYGE